MRMESQICWLQAVVRNGMPPVQVLGLLHRLDGYALVLFGLLLRASVMKGAWGFVAVVSCVGFAVGFGFGQAVPEDTYSVNHHWRMVEKFRKESDAGGRN